MATTHQPTLPQLVTHRRNSPREFAFGMVRQLFEPVLAAASETVRDELLVGAAEKATVLFKPVDLAVPSPDEDVSFATLHGLFWLVANLCAHEPLMLVMDDLHWSDTPSLRFLTYLLPRLEGLPLLVLAAMRPAEPTADQHLLSQITIDPFATIVHPAPLSPAASAQLVRAALAQEAGEAFCLACHTATKGNPLLLHDLIDLVIAEGVEPTAAGAVRLGEMGSRVVGRRVALRLTRLGPAATALCGAVAILGDRAGPAHAAALGGLTLAEALRMARLLTDIDVLYQRPASRNGPTRLSKTLGFVHPLVRAAVYEGLSEGERLAGHTCAAQLLFEADAAAEQVAAHLLLVPPVGDVFAVTTLRRAANEAILRGSPEAAVTYLERCLAEPLSEPKRAEVLLELGTAAHFINMTKAVEFLNAALAFTWAPEQRAVISETLARVLYLLGRDDEAIAVLSGLLEEFDDEHASLRRRLKAGILQVAIANPALEGLASELINELRDASPHADIGGKMVDSIIAFRDMLAAVPGDPVVAAAKRLADTSFFEQTQGSETFARICFVFMAADVDETELTALFETGLMLAHRRGSLLALAGLKCFRALGWLWHGFLAEAETNARDAMRVIDTAQLDRARLYAAAYLADSLMEQGHIDEAAAVLAGPGLPERAPPTGHWYWLLDSRARLLLLQGRTLDGLEAMLACGQRFAAHGGFNPAVVAWRSSAALALRTLGRDEEAQALAAEELALARQWGAPRALGRALRILGLLRGNQGGIELLRQAVAVLAPSPAKLEHAKTLIELGAALRRAGRRKESRQYLRQGVEYGQICGAVPLVERGWSELRASGARPRHIQMSGPDALTPSERRVAQLATAGHSNREIAQALFITTNTVEAHLTRTYRKLGVTGRVNLERAIQNL